MKKHFLLLVVSFILLSCNNDNTHQIKPSSSSLVNEVIPTNPKPQESNTPITIIKSPTHTPSPSQDDNILSPLPPILAFGQTDDYYYTLDDLVEYSEQEKKEKFESSHIFYINENVLKEGITKEAILNKDIIDVTEGSYPEYSPDNKLISFVKTENERKLLYIMKAGDLTGKSKQMVLDLDISSYSWINSSEILFSSSKNLYVLNIETKTKRVIFENSHISYSLSPNKKKLACVETKYSKYPLPQTIYDPKTVGDIYQSLFIYDIETKTKDIIIENKLIDYIKIDNNSDSYRPLYYFWGGFKWNENNEDIALPYYDATKIIKISTKNKELIELFDLSKTHSDNSYISKIFYYGKNGDLMFVYIPDSPSTIDGHEMILALKNTPIDKKLYIVSDTTKNIFVSKEKYLDNIYFFSVPFEEYISFIDIQDYFKDLKRSYKHLPFKSILPYSFLH